MLELQDREWKTDRGSQQGLVSPASTDVAMGSPRRLEGKASIRPTSPAHITAGITVDTARTRAGDHTVVIQRWWPRSQPKAAGWKVARRLIVWGEGSAGQVCIEKTWK